MIRTRLINRLRDERGIALPVALAVLFSVAGLATVAGRSAIVTSHQSQRDRNAKAAIQAAQSGLEAAVYQTNMLQPGNTQCVVKDPTTGALNTAAVQADGYCAPMTETMGDSATYSVRVSQVSTATVNGQNLAERQVVATGTVNGVTRRATVTVDASTGTPLFPFGYAMVGRESITFKNNAIIAGGIGSNGNITFGTNAEVCGPVTWGPGKTMNQGNNFSQCAGAPAPAMATQPFAFQPVDMTGANATNDNGRLTGLNGTGKDICGASSSCSRVLWDAGTRVLTIQNNGVLTLTGNVYSLCRLEIQTGGQLKISARTTPLYLYIDTPESCGTGTGMGSAVLEGSVLNVNANPATFVLLVAGSATKATSVTISDNVKAAEAPMAIYAPNSTVDFKNNLDWKGALIAKTISIKNNANITYDSRVSDISLGSSVRFYEAQAYKECASDPPTSVPNSGC
jgi:Tfp pilus assembly protein PilX